MLGAIRVVSVERGHDPRDFVLVPFGGAGPLHGGALSRLIGCPVQLVPPAPGVLSALGLLASSLRAEFSRSCVQRDGPLRSRPDHLGLRRPRPRCVGVADSGRRAGSVASDHLACQLALRGSGQRADPAVGRHGNRPGGASKQSLAAFHAEHERLYSFRFDDVPVEMVTLRVDALGLLPTLKLRRNPLERSRRTPSLEDSASLSPKVRSRRRSTIGHGSAQARSFRVPR